MFDCYLSCAEPGSVTSCAANTCCGPIVDAEGLESVQAPAEGDVGGGGDAATANNIEV